MAHLHHPNSEMSDEVAVLLREVATSQIRVLTRLPAITVTPTKHGYGGDLSTHVADLTWLETGITCPIPC